MLDIKTVRPNAFRYADDWPRDEWVLQLGGYAIGNHANKLYVDVVDRGGTNTNRTIEIDKDEAMQKAAKRILELDEIRASGELPPHLPPQIKQHRTRGELSSIGWVADWQCGYCPYYGGECTPAAPKDEEQLAKLVSGRWVPSASRIPQDVIDILGTDILKSNSVEVFAI